MHGNKALRMCVMYAISSSVDIPFHFCPGSCCFVILKNLRCIWSKHLCLNYFLFQISDEAVKDIRSLIKQR